MPRRQVLTSDYQDSPPMEELLRSRRSGAHAVAYSLEFPVVFHDQLAATYLVQKRVCHVQGGRRGVVYLIAAIISPCRWFSDYWIAAAQLQPRP